MMNLKRFLRFSPIALIVAIYQLGAAQTPTSFLRGGDVSEIPQVEAAGGHYSYHGKQGDPFLMMKEAGWNFVRFRIWNDPKGGWCDKAQTLALAKRAAAEGIKFSLDFHYSDWWADPGKQTKPAAWKDLPFEKLVKATYDYTRDVVSATIAQGTPPYMVQVGNEITGGMLWPDGKVSGNDPATWKPLITLLSAGFQAVHDAAGTHTVITMIHLDRGGDNKGATWWFDNAIKNGLQFDTIGLSYYPVWHGQLSAMQANVNDLALRYHKDIYIVETGYPWVLDERSRSSEHVEGDSKGLLAEYPATPKGQCQFLAKVTEIIQHIPEGRGKGLLYWAPTWISPNKKPSPYDNLALFNYGGDSLPSFDTIGGH
jgi:arabinogalactan endo-1,4-beta-galactosidase